MKILASTFPFGNPDPTPKKQLSNFDVVYNNLGYEYHDRDVLTKVLTEVQPEIIIAGTEGYDAAMLDLVPMLKMISRVGIGVDSVDLEECKARGIVVTNTPDAPSNAVAEMAIAQMIVALRHLRQTDCELRKGKWNRFIGREIRGCEVGIIGMGRIGTLVAQKLGGMKPRRIYINDIVRDRCINIERCEYETKNQILCNCDVITIHIPYSERNHHFIDRDDFALMKPDAVLINTARANIVHEPHLIEWLADNPDAYAVVDTLTEEPYAGPLNSMENCSLTPHIGSCSRKSRHDMEVGATEEVLNFLDGRDFNNRVV